MKHTDPTLLLTRPRAASEAFWAAVEPAFGATLQVMMSPLIEIVPTHQTPDLAGINGVIFSSVQGVEHGGPASDLPAFCVGQKTTEAARQRGWNARFSGQNANALVLDLQQSHPTAPLLHIGGIHKRGLVAQTLTDAGVQTTDISVYNQKLLQLSDDAISALEREKPVIVPLFSPRTARQFAQQVKRCAQVHIIALSPQVLTEVAGIDARTCSVARTPDRDGMVEMLQIVLRRVEAT